MSKIEESDYLSLSPQHPPTDNGESWYYEEKHGLNVYVAREGKDPVRIRISLRRLQSYIERIDRLRQARKRK